MQNPQSKPWELTQVAVVVKDLEKAIQHYSSLGIGPFRNYEVDIPQGEVRGKPCPLHLKLAMARLGPVVLELIEAQEGENIYWEFFQAKGEGLHHLGFNVTDLSGELARFRQAGIGVLQRGEVGGGGFAYLDTDRVGGVILELIQRRT